jgi:hypothetical protein
MNMKSFLGFCFLMSAWAGTAMADNIGDDNPLIRWKCTQGPCWGTPVKPYHRTDSVASGRAKAQEILRQAESKPGLSPSWTRWIGKIKRTLAHVPLVLEDKNSPECRGDGQQAAYFGMQMKVENGTGKVLGYLPEGQIHFCPNSLHLTPEAFAQLLFFQAFRYGGLVDECPATESAFRLMRLAGAAPQKTAESASCGIAVLELKGVRPASSNNALSAR